MMEVNKEADADFNHDGEPAAKERPEDPKEEESKGEIDTS